MERRSDGKTRAGLGPFKARLTRVLWGLFYDSRWGFCAFSDGISLLSVAAPIDFI